MRLPLVRMQRSNMSLRVAHLCASKSDYPHVTAVQPGIKASLGFTKPDLEQPVDDFDPATAMRAFSAQSQQHPRVQLVKLQQALQNSSQDGAKNARSTMSWKDIV